MSPQAADSSPAAYELHFLPKGFLCTFVVEKTQKYEYRTRFSRT